MKKKSSKKEIKQEADNFDIYDKTSIEEFGDDVLIQVREIADEILNLAKENDNNNPVIITEKIEKLVIQKI